MWRSIVAAAFCLAAVRASPSAASLTPADAPKEMPRLARQLIESYHDADRRKYLDTLFRLQLVAGQYRDALSSIEALRAVDGAGSPRLASLNVEYAILARARLRAVAENVTFETAFREEFDGTMNKLDDRTSALVMAYITTNAVQPLQRAFESRLAIPKDLASLPIPDAVSLVRAYQLADSFRTFAALTPPLVAADDRRHYVVEPALRIRTGGGTVCSVIVRPRHGPARLSTLFSFTVYFDLPLYLADARRSASNGYAGVIGFTRGKGCSPDRPSLYLHDGKDAADVIGWISKQPWSDGRVGMYGGSYAGFTQWSVARRPPKALKALMAGAPVAPGIDVPMEGNVFFSFLYPYPFYTTNVKGLDEATYYDADRWARLNRTWYISGRAYRDLPAIDGTPNPIWTEWVSHPSLDSYWLNLVPSQTQFASLKIPVLSTAGYYFGGPGAAVYYVSHHYKARPAAEHYLLIGPYNHPQAQKGMVDSFGDMATSVNGYRVDQTAQIDMVALRYEWFDYVLKGRARPALPQDKINYQVTGANVWRHAPSLEGMAKRHLRLYFNDGRSAAGFRLTKTPTPGVSMTLRVDLRDRSDVDRTAPGGGIDDTQLDSRNGIVLASDPLTTPLELSGLFSGALRFATNKRDFDFQIDLFEMTPTGHYIRLAPYWIRASFIGDLSRRRLLVPGRSRRVTFKGNRLMSRQLQAGSRVVAVLTILKSAEQPINYGSGKDVNSETIADAGDPLTTRWFGDSYIDLPVGR